MKAILFLVAAGLLQIPLAAQTPSSESTGPEQPIPFNHKLHLSKGLACKDCHTNPGTGEAMTLPQADKCMVCHSTIKKESAPVQKLAQFAKDKEQIPWKRVYEIPDWVYFSHKTHLDGGKTTCEDCHGQVKDLEVMRKVKTLNMAFCVDCHRTRNAANTCTTCHEEQ